MPSPASIPAGTEHLSGWATLFVLIMTALTLAFRPIVRFGRWVRNCLMAPVELRLERLEQGNEEVHDSVKAIAQAIQRMETNCAAHCPGTTNGTTRPTEVNGFPHQIENIS